MDNLSIVPLRIVNLTYFQFKIIVVFKIYHIIS